MLCHRDCIPLFVIYSNSFKDNVCDVIRTFAVDTEIDGLVKNEEGCLRFQQGLDQLEIIGQ